MRYLRASVCALCALAAILTMADAARAVGDFHIQLNPGLGFQNNPDALGAFQRAAAAWEQYIASPISVNINIDLGNFGSDSDVIASTTYGSAELNLDYTTVRNAMAARAGRPGDALMAFLPTTDQVSANVPATAGFRRDTIGLTHANQRALGLVPNPRTDTTIDGYITFNRAQPFDYNRANGIDSDKFDFESAATHEIGHVLGFISDTDTFDFNPNLTDNATTLDLFRFSADAPPTTPAEFRSFPREMRPGHEAVTTDLVHSYRMSTGTDPVQGGDGRQASHWKDDFIFDLSTGNLYFGPLIGIMDPTLNPGDTELISDADVRAMELIGYDTVPEPGGAVVVIAAGAVLFGRRRRTGSKPL